MLDRLAMAQPFTVSQPDICYSVWYLFSFVCMRYFVPMLVSIIVIIAVTVSCNNVD